MAQDLTPLEAEKLKQDQTSVERNFWQKLRGVARKVPFIDELVATYFCAMDPETPLKVKAILFGALAYFILPFDFVADFMPVFGFADDATVLFAAIRAVLPHIKTQHRIDAQQALDRLLKSSA
ncbi:MAG TPA: YkvA family protein [Dongiaceae bacterium]|nr:YkvA family protein [Dongiaceae bacterium]